MGGDRGHEVGHVADAAAEVVAGGTDGPVEKRTLTVRRVVAFTNDYPWRWTAADVEEWSTAMVSGGLAHTTLRNYQPTWHCFSAYLCDLRFSWDTVCEARFGSHPTQVFHEGNTAVHRSKSEGRPADRPFS